MMACQVAMVTETAFRAALLSFTNMAATHSTPWSVPNGILCRNMAVTLQEILQTASAGDPTCLTS